MRLSLRVAVALTALLVLPSLVRAAPITTLFATGVASPGVLITAVNGTPDPHWDVISGPGIGAPIDAVRFQCCYFAEGPNSMWISSNSIGGSGAGAYLFRTTFDLTGFDPLLTSIAVLCATDNGLDGVFLNGVLVPGDCDSFGGFAPAFDIASGFIAGINTLDFNVVDFGFPMAFRAEFGSDTVAAAPPSPGVPEPATLVLLAAGAGAGFVARRRRRA
jgi:hypothetical protein